MAEKLSDAYMWERYGGLYTVAYSYARDRNLFLKCWTPSRYQGARLV